LRIDFHYTSLQLITNRPIPPPITNYQLPIINTGKSTRFLSLLRTPNTLLKLDKRTMLFTSVPPLGGRGGTKKKDHLAIPMGLLVVGELLWVVVQLLMSLLPRN
jgi:hypothetical protein